MVVPPNCAPTSPEFISVRLSEWCEQQGIILHLIQPGKPTQNACIERFNGSFRRELLDAHLFRSLAHVRQLVEEWMLDYNTQRPHSNLNKLTELVRITTISLLPS